jgi:nickel-type superoxide dismutase maturation protease
MFFFPLSVFKISGHSMEPTIRNGQFVLVNRLAYVFSSPQKGDIVAAKAEGKFFVKRIQKRENIKYFLVGDNQHDSLDSRKFGMIGKDQIIGKVMLLH